ncbi:MAG: hypothetical protein HYX53_13125 [Chloroflexi bacterium]|nr:hypothetical protein [Chloroflexota bacterium]
MTRTFARRALLAAALAAALALAACGGGGGGTATPADEDPPAVSGRVGGGATARSDDGRLDVTSPTRTTAVDVTIRELRTPPAPPAGWKLLVPVYEIVGKDENGPLTKLDQPMGLKFSVPGDGIATVLYYDGAKWAVIESERDPAGNVTAAIDHLSPYTVGKPVTGAGSGGPTPAPPWTPTPRGAKSGPALGTPTVPPPTAPPGIAADAPTPLRPAATPTPRSPVATPGANVTVVTGSVSSQQAKAGLEQVAEKYKGRKVTVSGAQGYTAGAAIALPPSLESLLATAGGSLYYGIYSGVNEVATTVATSGSVSGTLSFFAEPKTSFPATADDALAQLRQLFPGASGAYAVTQSGTTGYIFTATTGAAAYVLGFVQYQSVPIAYLVAGTGTYSASVAASGR